MKQHFNTIYDAFDYLVDTDKYKYYSGKNDSYGSHLRHMRRSRERGSLGATAIFNVLCQFGYQLSVTIEKEESHFLEGI